MYFPDDPITHPIFSFYSSSIQNGKTVSVKFGGGGLFSQSKPKILFFYPKDNSPGCNLEAKAFRDAYAELRKLGADVIGISSDSVESHSAFCSELELPYTLLSDEGDSVRSMYGVPKDLFGLLPGRQTFVIGKDGEVKTVFNNQFKPELHVEAAIEALSN